MPSDYDKIREDNILEYGRGTRHLSFLGKLYTDRTHFVFELLQNAEDAGANRILFSLFKDRLEVTHNGRPFNERDVRGVCGVGMGTKTEDLTQIGKFGIGFKSVYAYTADPEIHSGDEHFKIENYVRPCAVPSRQIENSWSTLFVLPFNKEEISPETACQEIGKFLRNLSARTLLFLRRIKKIEYRLPDSTGGMYRREEIVRDPARQVSVIGQNNGTDEEERWLIFERSVLVPEKPKKNVLVEVGFCLETEEKAGKKEERIHKVEDSPLVVYFPTEKETNFGFLIQGPYRTTPSRDNIPRDDDWNATLVNETACLLTEILPHIKQLGLLTVSFLESLPIRTEDFPKVGMFYPIVEAIRKTLKEGDFLPTDDGAFVSAQNAKLARGAELRKLLKQEQLSLLFQSTETIRWLAGEITQDRTPDLRAYLKELGVEEIDAEGFARKIALPFLSRQEDEWFVAFYDYLSGQETTLWRAPRWKQDSIGPLRAKPILRLQDNSQEAPFKSDGTTPNAFLPPPEETDFPVVKRSIAEHEKAMAFLRKLGLSEPDVFDEIIEYILPKYAIGTDRNIIQEQYTDDINKISRAMERGSESEKEKVKQKAIGTPFLKAVDSSGSVAFKKPGEIYLDTSELRRYFSYSSRATWFLHEELSSFSNVWRAMSVADLPRRLEVSYLPQGVKKEDSRWQDTTHNYELDGLQQFLEAIPALPGFSEKRDAACILWCFLETSLEKDNTFFEGRYEWFNRKQRQKRFDSSILRHLRGAQWVPTKSETLEKPGEIKTDQLPDEFRGATELIKKLEVISEEKMLEHATALGVSLEVIELMKNNPDAVERLKAEIANKERQATFPIRPVGNSEHRQERIAEQILDAPKKEYKRRDTSVRVTRGEIYPVPWLRETYTNETGQMVCQICKEEMPFRKRDGEYYFEAVEALDRNLFPSENNQQFLALCPVCAARYKEFVKNDEDAMLAMKEDLANRDDCEVPLELGDIKTSIRFVETHRHDLGCIINS